jgi:squalene synthase HpnC
MASPPGADPRVRQAYEHCARLARSHAENFPVASLLLPKEKRPALAAVYAFARTADDFADEGDVPPAERIARLDAWGNQLEDAYAGRAETPVFVALADAAQRYGIPRGPLEDLLTAFRMDVTTLRHPTFDHLLHYCRHSADPVGRIVLHVFGEATPENVLCSDRICTALQLTNFWQDVAVDLKKGRVYLPLEDLERFGYTERSLAAREVSQAYRDLLRFQVERTCALFDEGRPLLRRVPPLLRRELGATWLGGVRILEKIAEQDYDTLRRRPGLTPADTMRILARALTGFR